MALVFIPPAAPLVPMTSPARPNPADTLFRHYRPMDAGINIWIVGGVVTTTEPDYEFVTPDATFLGSHIHEVTASEAALLTAAGYTVTETP